jgi:hypothetical protein
MNIATSDSRAYLAPLRSTQIPRRGISDTLGTLCTKILIRGFFNEQG